MIKGQKPFIGASDSNNGVTAFVKNTNTSEDRNVLGVNYNGSVVENFYQMFLDWNNRKYMIKLRRFNSSFPDFARKGGSDG